LVLTINGKVFVVKGSMQILYKIAERKTNAFAVFKGKKNQ